MNTILLVAGTLAALVGVIHSVLGEVLIFSRMRQGTLVPRIGQPLLRERHVRILWATWHTVTIFGLGFAAILFQAADPANPTMGAAALNTVAVVMLASSFLVCFATKGMHPGWVGLLAVALLIWLA